MSTMVEPRDRIVEVDGLRMHYLDWGNPDKPTVVLLHGLRGHAHSWDDVSTALSPDFHVLALDQRGRGLTDWAKDGDYGIDAFVGDLAGFCRVVGLEKFILMGHSMGARNAMAFADKHAHRLEKLVLSEFGPQINPKGGQRIAKELIDVPEEFDTLDDAIAYMTRFNRYASAPVMHRRELYASKELPNGKIGWRYDIEIRQQFREDRRPPMKEVWSVIPNISCPTLIVRGTETDILPLEVAERMVQVMPKARLVHVERAGHMLMEDNPERFTQVVREFLAQGD